MAARFLERITFVEVHVVCYGDHRLGNLDLVERVFFLLAPSSPPGGRGAALGDNNSVVSVCPRIKV